MERKQLTSGFFIILALFSVFGYFTMHTGFIRTMDDLLHLGWGLFLIGAMLLFCSRLEEKKDV